MAQRPEPAPEISDKLKDDPLNHIDIAKLKEYVKEIHTLKFGDDFVTLDELWIGAQLARNFNNHDLEEVAQEATEHGDAGDTTTEGDAQDDRIDVAQGRPSINPSIPSISERRLLNKRQRDALAAQGSMAFWRESKDLLITLIACCMASLTQGWDQVANGNLGWPAALGLHINPDGTGEDIWTFGIANAVMWFSAATLGCIFIDPICHSLPLGRRGAVLIAAMFSFASVIGGSQATSYQGYIASRVFLGVGIGAKASIVPIWESEILPPGNRGRLLVLWQVFTATGIFAGSVATYIFRTNWRNQVLTGAIPAFTLLILAYLCCESPRWLILQGKYAKAFETLVKLRKDRILAAEELSFIHFQVQTERAAVLKRPLNYGSGDPRVHLRDRVSKILKYPRNLRAALATMIVMISQQLSGINILAFLASIFFNTASLRKQPDNPSNPAAVEATNRANANDSLRLAIGFGAANAVFSLIAYFLIERENPYEEDLETKHRWYKPKPPRWVLGRRSLLLLSLAGGTMMLFILTFLLGLSSDNSAKLPIVMLFIILFTLFYSPGAGAVPYVYSPEVWPNEGREIGMSIAVFWNFLGAGFLGLLVPRGLQWGASKLFGLFTGLSFLGSILVFLYVPSPGYAMTLDDMSRKFDKPVWDYARDKIRNLLRKKGKGAQEGAQSDTTRDETETKDAGRVDMKDAGRVETKDAGTVERTTEATQETPVAPKLTASNETDVADAKETKSME